MNKSELRKLAGLPAVKEAVWSANADTKKHPPEGLFASGTSKSILKWIKANHADLKSAMASLNFYINRSGKNLTVARKAELEQIKNDIRKAYPVKESSDLSLLRRMAGLPIKEADLSDIDDEHQKSEEPEEKGEAAGTEETQTEELPEIVKQIAAEAEGKTGEEMEELIHKIYQAGFTDGQAEPKTDEELPAKDDAEPKPAE